MSLGVTVSITSMLSTHPLGVRGPAAAEGGQGPLVQVLETLVQRPGVLQVSAGPMTSAGVLGASVGVLWH